MTNSKVEQTKQTNAVCLKYDNDEEFDLLIGFIASSYIINCLVGKIMNDPKVKSRVDENGMEN